MEISQEEISKIPEEDRFWIIPIMKSMRLKTVEELDKFFDKMKEESEEADRICDEIENDNGYEYLEEPDWKGEKDELDD